MLNESHVRTIVLQSILKHGGKSIIHVCAKVYFRVISDLKFTTRLFSPLENQKRLQHRHVTSVNLWSVLCG